MRQSHRTRWLGRMDAPQRSAANRPAAVRSLDLPTVSAASSGLIDFRLVLHEHLSDSYEWSSVMLAKAGCDGTLELLTSAWERLLDYRREELEGKTLLQLMWCNQRSAAVAVAAILDELNPGPVDLRVRCRNGKGKYLTLHRLYDRQERMMYIVAEENPGPLTEGFSSRDAERRSIARQASPTA